MIKLNCPLYITLPRVKGKDKKISVNLNTYRNLYHYTNNEVKKKYELNYDRAVQDLYDIRDKALAAGSFNAAISAQNSLLRVGGLIVDRKEVLFGKIDQMSRAEIENRLKQLMGDVVEAVIEEDEDSVLPVANLVEQETESQNQDDQE